MLLILLIFMQLLQWRLVIFMKVLTDLRLCHKVPDEKLLLSHFFYRGSLGLYTLVQYYALYLGIYWEIHLRNYVQIYCTSLAALEI